MDVEIQFNKDKLHSRKVQALSEGWLPIEAAGGIDLTDDVRIENEKRSKNAEAREQLLERKAHIFQGELPKWKDFANQRVWLDPKMSAVGPDAQAVMREHKLYETKNLFESSIIVVDEPLQIKPSSKWCWVAALNGCLVCNAATLAESSSSPRCALDFQKSQTKTWKIYMSPNFVSKCTNMVASIGRSCSTGSHLKFVTWAQYVALKEGTTRMTICMPKEKLNEEPWKSDKFAAPPDVALKKLIKWNHSKSYIDNPT